MSFPGLGEWIVILVIVILIFGASKLRNIGSDLGAAIKNFRQAMKGDGKSDKDETPPPGQAPGPSDKKH